MVGDFKRVHRSGIIACHFRAAEWRHKAVELAAHELLQVARQEGGYRMTRRVVFFINLTTDGMYVLEGALADLEPAEDVHRFANELMRDTGDEVMGRVMYGVMDYWDELDLDDPATTDVEREFATFWRETPKRVVSRGRPDLRPTPRSWRVTSSRRSAR